MKYIYNKLRLLAVTISMINCQNRVNRSLKWQYFSYIEHTLFKTDRSHSFYLHGHSFYVVGQKRKAFVKSADHAKKLDSDAHLVQRKLDGSVLKNTVVVPAAGVSVVRFIADNPGNDEPLIPNRFQSYMK